MKSHAPIETTLVNGLGGDPAVYGFLPRTGDAILFDLGAIDAMANRDLLKVRVALVSHAHIDHFIGFDRWLRVNIPHFRPLEVCGPPGMIAHVRGKLTGYLWNLVEPGQIRFTVHEVHPDGRVVSARLSSDDGFVPHPTERVKPALTALDAPEPAAPVAVVTSVADARIEAVALDHGTPSIAYALQFGGRFKVKEGALEALGEKPGSWIRDLQIAVAHRELDKTFTVGGRTYAAGELSDRLFEVNHPRPLGYATDIGFTAENLARTRALFRGCDHLVCEANYRDPEVGKAVQRMHLTTRQAALIAADAGVNSLGIFHVSNIYADDPEASVTEAAGHFARFRAMDQTTLNEAVRTELARAPAG